MRTPDDLVCEYAALLDAYLVWLHGQDRRRAAEYEDAIFDGAPEGHVFEACVWRLLVAWGFDVAAESQKAAGPDFACRVGSADLFYVEATARQADSFTDEMGIKDEPVPLMRGGDGDKPVPFVGSVKPWHKFHLKVLGKADQVGARPKFPVLLAYGSVHRWAGGLVPDAALLDEALGLKSSVWVDGLDAGMVVRKYVGDGALPDFPTLAGILYLPAEATRATLHDWAMQAAPVRGVLNPHASSPFTGGVLPQVTWLSA